MDRPDKPGDDGRRRISEHKEKTVLGFTAKYGVDQLVWYALHESRESAFRRERQIKEWKRAWRIEMIERANPTWKDFGAKPFMS